MVDERDVDLLVERARRGEAEAFGALYDHFVDRIHRFIAYRVRAAGDAEDLTQVVFVKAIEALPRYQPRGVPFASWLFRLARNAVIDFERTRHEHLDLDAAVERQGEDRGPDELALLHLTVDELSTALQTLTREQQDVIAYRFFAGLSSLETAAIMGKRDGTVRGLQFRALEALRRRLSTPDDQAVPGLDAAPPAAPAAGRVSRAAGARGPSEGKDA